MRLPPLSAAFAGAVLALAAGAADAYLCFVVLDAKDAVVYRDTRPPVDMSDQGTAARNALRQRGQFLMIVTVDQCDPIGPGLAASASDATRLADFVSGVRPVMLSGDAAAAGDARAGAAGIPAPAPAPRAEPVAIPMQVRTRPASGRY
jgi:hypothetical protein